MNYRRWKTKHLLFIIVIFALCSLCLVRYLKPARNVVVVTDESGFDMFHGAEDSATSRERKLLWSQIENARFENLRLKRDSNEVPVVIVDQHQEVIPYWFKAVDQGLIPRHGNTLVHIDGHSDMAPPEKYDIFKRFNYVANMSQNSYLPLMQSNDVFIASAVMADLIDKVIWVQPDWNDGSNFTQIMNAYIGKHRKSSGLCLCFRPMRKASRKPAKFFCDVLNRESEEEMSLVVNVTDCNVIKHYKYFVISESKFKKVLNFRNPRSIIVDIDEDHFGVESGVQSFINKGVTLQSQEVLDGILSSLYCPKSTEDEMLLNRKVQFMFLSAYHIKRKMGGDGNHPKDKASAPAQDVANTRFSQMFREEILQHTKGFICNEKMIENLALFMVMIDETQLKALSNARFCLFNSPRLNQMGTKIRSGFSVCHGTIFPEDTLNKIHVGTPKEIDKRSSDMKGILKYISSFIKPSLYTICRSLRDGYTPRNQQRYIEKQVLKAVTEVTRENGQKGNIVYDSQLVFGKEGWVNDGIIL